MTIQIVSIEDLEVFKRELLEEIKIRLTRISADCGWGNTVRAMNFTFNLFNIEKAVYGKSLTKKLIAGIVNIVMRNYKYMSLPEYNAVLKQFNVIAGMKNRPCFKKNSLLYSLIDERGKSGRWISISA